MAVIGPLRGWSGVRPLNEPPSMLTFVKGAMGGRRVYPPLIRNWDCGMVAMGIN